jgi:hypothetical protein
VEGDGDVLVATASPDGESPGVIGVELGKREVHDVELIGGGQCSGLVDGSSGSSVVRAPGVASGEKWFEDLGMGLVECMLWRTCLRWPLMVASEEGQCFIALRRVRPGKVL